MVLDRLDVKHATNACAGQPGAFSAFVAVFLALVADLLGSRGSSLCDFGPRPGSRGRASGVGKNARTDRTYWMNWTYGTLKAGRVRESGQNSCHNYLLWSLFFSWFSV